MTKKPGNSISKEEAYFRILKKLTVRGPLQPIQFESDDNLSIGQEDLIIPHTSAHYGLKELVNFGLISEEKTKFKTKKGLQIKEYRINFYGFLKLLSLSKDKKYALDIMNKIHLHMPLISHSFPSFKELFTEQQLFETLADVCSNTIIDIDFNAKKPDYSRKKLTPYTVPISASQLYCYKWIHTYHIEMKILQSKFTHIIMEDVIIGGEKNTKDSIQIESVKPFLLVSSLIICSFYHELIRRCSDLTYVTKGYPANNGRILVMEFLRRNKIILAEYLKFLNRLQEDFAKIAKDIIEIRKSVSKNDSS